MKEAAVDIKWRTVQLFLENYGVVEVEVDSENSSKARCSCPGFARGGRCKHTKYVKDVMANNDGHYSIQVSVDVNEDDAFRAIQDPESFRDFIVKYGKVEVID